MLTHARTPGRARQPTAEHAVRAMIYDLAQKYCISFVTAMGEGAGRWASSPTFSSLPAAVVVSGALVMQASAWQHEQH